MRSIFVLLILVMIGLNGKGQSVTALPDSVLSQCCLEVTLLNGNVTTVDWVFVQYVTRDGTGTKLFVEYAPNFGGIQWETQIRIQDDFDDVLERSKFIVIPFTVGSTDYGINRNWIANIEENTTTGGTWIYGRFGTPTKRKFSAVEDYETMKNLLLACRPRAIVVAENGLYTEGDTVRMGGFLIENTSITTEGYNWQMKDTLSSVEFGLDYNTPETLDTTVYWARRSGSVRQMVQLGRRYYYNSIRDTTGGLYSDLTHSWNSGDPFLQYQIFNPSAPTTGTAWFKIQKDNSFLNLSNDATNPYYSLGWAVTNTTASLGASESGSGDPGNGVVMGAYGFGTTEFLFMKTKAVDAGTATNGQYLQLIDNSSGEVDFATIDLSGYLQISDTAAMLLNYPSTTGWGLFDGGKTWRVDSSKVASRYYVSTSPTTIAANYAAISNGTNLVARNLFDNNTYVGILNSKPFQFGQWTTAGRPSGTTGYSGWNTTLGGEESYDGTRWNSTPKAVKNTFTSTYIPFTNSSGQFDENANFVWDNSQAIIGGGTGQMRIGGSNNGGYSRLFVNGRFTAKREYLLDRTAGTFAAYISCVVRDAGEAGALGTGQLGQSEFYTFGTPLSFGTFNNFPLSFSTVNTLRMQINTSGNMMIGTSTDAPSAILNIVSTTKGILPPRWTAAQLAAISSPATGLFGYQTDGTEGLYIKAAAGFKRVLWEGDAPPVNIYTGNGTFGSSRTGTLTDSLRFQFGGSDLFRLKSNGVLHVNMPTETNSFVITSTPNENYNNYRGKVFLTGTTSAFDTTTGSRRNNHEASYFSGINTVEGGYNVYYDAVAGYGNVVRKDVPQNVVFGVYNTVNSLGNVGVYGTFNDVSGQYTTVIGKYNTVPANYAFVVGRNNTVSQTNAFVYGNEISTTNLSLHGFGTLTPTERVDVGGNARIRGFLRVDGKLKVGSDSSFVHDPTQDTTYAKGTVRVQSGGVQIENTSLYPYLNIVATASSGNQEARLYMRSRGDFSPIIEFDAASSTSSGQSLPFYNYNTARGGQSVFRIGSEPGQFGARSIGRFSVFDSLGATRRFSFFSNGNAVFDSYGTGTKEAADLSKTQSNYIAGFATDGTVLDLEQKRDTTIYIEDADYDFSAALTTAQVSRRYNRVIFLMTTTAAAASDSELTLHTPDANLMQVEYLIRSTDETGGFSNVIRFGTNNAVDSTNGLASSYFPAAGQGVGIRAGLRSGAYKYFYY